MEKIGCDRMDAPSLITLYSPCLLKVSLPCQPPLPWVLWLAHRASLLPATLWSPQCLPLLPGPHSDLPLFCTSIISWSTWIKGTETGLRALTTSNRNVCPYLSAIREHKAPAPVWVQDPRWMSAVQLHLALVEASVKMHQLLGPK